MAKQAMGPAPPTRRARRASARAGLAVWLAVAACGVDPGPQRDEAVASLIAAERAFAAAAAERGIKGAFLANLADDAVLFRPGPVEGRKYLEANPGSPGLLAWDPEYADVSQDGELGYTTGPWTYRGDSGGAVLASGRYFTFWRRRAGGAWRALIDHGVTGPVEEAAVAAGSPVETAVLGAGAAAGEASALEGALLAADSAFAALFGDDAVGAAATASEGVRVLREGSAPLSGPAALRHGAPAGPIVFQTVGAGIAGSGDLGYTYGSYSVSGAADSAAARTGTYLRGWRRDGEGRWRLVVDLMKPDPPGK